MRHDVVNRFTPFISWILFSLVVLVGIFTIPSIGPAWDEPDNIFSGGQYLNFFRSGLDPAVLTKWDKTASYFADRIFTQDATTPRYPPIPNFVGTVLVLVGEIMRYASTPQHIIIVFHLATVFFLALLVATVYRFGRLLGLPVWASILAAIATFLYPTLFGHGLSYLKDTTQVSLFTLSMYYLARATITKKQKYLVIGAIIWGLGLATKFNAIYVPIIWVIWNIILILLGQKKKKQLRTLISWVLLLGLLGMVTAIAVWPYLWFHPIVHIREVIQYFTTVGEGYRVFWDGAMYQVGVGVSLWWYPWANLIFATPLILLIAVVGGFAGVFGHLTRMNDVGKIRLLLVIWIVLPLLRAVLPSAAFYDGIRHFMEVLPPFILLGVIGITSMTFKRLKFAPCLIGGILLCHLIFIDITYFPYSTGYLNILAQNPNERFDRDIEALSVKEGVEYLHKKYGTIYVWVPVGGHLSWYYLTGNDVYVYNPDAADSIILVNKPSHVSNTDLGALIRDTYVLDYEVRRGDTIFAWVYRKKG
ncbi:hypothetical protein A2Z00_03880 [Candidatus Gottesmanbacteria bacterium RBG_13_45_10]|uniref:Glycosyltransferase RgtA/B/C/D-like domain-containing protein n=1 Tax=Candidatus Gottesmanbacteria bacterium RBG_13_45_10 TaxID=1798370 RepID=A0A1F5ZII3_9BACT|nr:MAG: hypothetical protein A2Z00_03880 [Candidatus Gottesmanbacteria bacterium RBG_13_45_10]